MRGAPAMASRGREADAPAAIHRSRSRISAADRCGLPSAGMTSLAPAGSEMRRCSSLAMALQAVLPEDRSNAGAVESCRVAVGGSIPRYRWQPEQAAQGLRHVLREVLLAVRQLPTAIAGPGHEADRCDQRDRVEPS